jgi:Ca-activated chloride channel family protein
MSELVKLRTALDKACRPLTGEFVTTVLVEISPSRMLRRLPLNLGLLLDVSESMQGEKLQRATESVLAVLEHLQPTDLVTLVAFGSRAEVLLRGQAAGQQARALAREAMSRLRAEGVTQLLRGLEMAMSELRRNAGPDRASFVVLLSDGYPTTNMGYVDTNVDAYLQRVDREMRERGISLSTIGLGDAGNYDQTFLRALADKGNGQFLYCSSPDELGERFAAEFRRIQRSVLGDVQLTVRHLAGALRRLWRVYPEKKLFDPPALDHSAFTVPIGALQDEQPQAFLLDVVTTAQPGQTAGRTRLLEVEAAWLSEGAMHHVTQPVVLEFTGDERALAQRNPEVVRLAAECLDALLEERLEHAVARGDRAQQTSVLVQKKQLTVRLGKTEATRVLEEMEEALARGESITQDALARSSAHTKPTQRLG